MAMRSVGSATINFGLLSVPVKLFPATESKSGIGFNLLHKGCGSRLKQQYVCLADGKTVERDEMVKGFEHAKGEYVVFTPEELKALEEHATGTIEIASFVPANSVDPLYFDKPYFLAPDKGASKAFALLAAGMMNTGRVAVATYAARGKQYVEMLRPVQVGAAIGIIAQQLLYADEVRSIEDVEIAAAKVDAAQLALACKLIEQSSDSQYRPEMYKDIVKERILAAIETKVAGGAVEMPKPAASTGSVIDIMAALQASLDLKKKAG